MNVVPITASGDILIEDRDAIMRRLRSDLYARDPVATANYIGVSVSCIYAIRSGRTKWPRHETLFALLQALGYQMWLRKK